MIRTSENSPLRIAELPLGTGAIGLTLCPGKKDKNAMYTPCWRSLETDMQAVKDWGAGIIVTLMEEFELNALHVTDIGSAAGSLGMRWWHMPVKDQYPLDWEYDPQWDFWTLNCALLRHFLHSGGRVLIHCRGGLGRTGTLAARLLMEEGMDAESAMQTVRVVRNGAIETQAQENYLRKFKAQQDILRERRETFVCLPQKRVEQLVRLLLEVPWACRQINQKDGWSQTLKTCLIEEAADNPWEAIDKTQGIMREILAALYDAAKSSLPFAYDYFDMVCIEYN